MNGAGKSDPRLHPADSGDAAEAGAMEAAVEQAVPAGLKRIYFADGEGSEYGMNAEIRLNKGDSVRLTLMGELANGEKAVLAGMTNTITHSTNDVSVDAAGKVTAIRVGASLIRSQVLAGFSELKTNDLWAVVDDEDEFTEEANIFSKMSFTHPRMTARIGEPATIEPGDVYPELTVRPAIGGRIGGELLLKGEVVARIPDAALAKGETMRLSIPGKADKMGVYELRLVVESETVGKHYDSYFFTVWPPRGIPEGGSRIAFIGEENAMIYASDYRGNKILDFSNAGYGGGGVSIPDVDVLETVEPGEGDDTARIQAAIDRAAARSADGRGFRGAVLLKRGTYEVGSTLSIRTGGIVLRGEGDGEDGTVIRGTGAARRNLVEIGGASGPKPDPETGSDIADLYVPSGARSFRVSDASGFRAGDKIIVRRVGNSRWIHEIGMDRIFNRPGGGATQWPAFDLDFDREITDVRGDEITVDAPIACAIERRWGGGQIYKYDDGDRIQHVGVEHIRAVSDFDPGVIDTVMDNDTTEPYFADENHAERFVDFGSVKNGWVRGVTGFHLSYSLVRAGRDAKWITVQDCRVHDMVSIVTGGRRYAIHLMGQLNLAQRNYIETARHAFVVDCHVPGPNVFLDSVSAKDYNTSEPHHRWSVGGLFDNVTAPIAIRDRAWLGSGHGWAGANYVTWNTTGELTSQQPPTAQNYAIGHIGPKVPGLVPLPYDPRPRADAYWEREGRHVEPDSLYLRQLEERLGKQAVKNIRER